MVSLLDGIDLLKMGQRAGTGVPSNGRTVMGVSTDVRSGVLKQERSLRREIAGRRRRQGAETTA
jgi:hypothetical protein